MKTLRAIALTLIIIGALNWGLIALFQFDLVAAIFGGQDSFFSRIIYGLVGLSGLYYAVALLNPVDVPEDRTTRRLNYGTEFGEDTDIDTPSPRSMQTSDIYRRPTGKDE
ncbi:DUF378 domain-containing protein [Oceanobacillus piezotolerans]|uniref:DUF378 domain-containing protein n=1 Tax=Oceanobacillus piezotolerans TaxID=2448030 RepID=A0A498DEJ5_9BACI|nr:DUF378 domain-containing protein [Oceanobacillus piezotolerans]RLL48506.1 DUF378 domain-containing protein [Oceanobacillus piezotolerans]